MKHIAIYVRVSSKSQTTRSQLPDLKAWAASQGQPLQWYEDHGVSGKTMDRPAWNKLDAAMRAGKVSQVVCWRLDRLGRTASGLTTLFDDLQRRRVNLVSLKDGLDLSTPAGRLLAGVLASVAQFENELRGERVRAGQAVARAKGKTWGGSKPGERKKVTPTQTKVIRQLRSEGTNITAIARATGLSRVTIYSVLRAF